jgi:thymidine kinase
MLGIEKSRLQNRTVAVFNWCRDNRYSHDDVVVNHLGFQVSCKKVASLLEQCNSILENKIMDVFIDEGQFFDDLLEFVMWCKKNNINLLIAGLQSDMNMKPWSNIVNVIPFATKIKNIRATCSKCSNKVAIYTRLREPHSDLDTNILIGSSQYIPLCDECNNS